MKLVGIITPSLATAGVRATAARADLLALLPFTNRILIAPTADKLDAEATIEAWRFVRNVVEEVSLVHPSKTFEMLPAAPLRDEALLGAYARIEPESGLWVLDMTGSQGVHGDIGSMPEWVRTRPGNVRVGYIRASSGKWNARLYRFEKRYVPRDGGRRIGLPPPDGTDIDLRSTTDAPSQARAPIHTGE